jgi:glycerol-3-phosphate acyltransferase PlsY
MSAETTLFDLSTAAAALGLAVGVGSLPTGALGRLAGLGSTHAGALAVFYAGHRGAALLMAVADMSKILAAAAVALGLTHRPSVMALAVLAAVAGHIWSPVRKRRAATVAAPLGGVFALSPWAGVFAIVLWGGLFWKIRRPATTHIAALAVAVPLVYLTTADPLRTGAAFGLLALVFLALARPDRATLFSRKEAPWPTPPMR